MEELSWVITCSNSQLACGVVDAKHELGSVHSMEELRIGSVHSVEELGSVHCTVQATGCEIVTRLVPGLYKNPPVPGIDFGPANISRLYDIPYITVITVHGHLQCISRLSNITS